MTTQYFNRTRRIIIISCIVLQIILCILAVFSSYATANKEYYNDKYINTYYTAIERGETLEYIFKDAPNIDIQTVTKTRLSWNAIDRHQIFSFFIITEYRTILLATSAAPLRLTKSTFEFLLKNENFIVPFLDEAGNTKVGILHPIFLNGKKYYIYIYIPIENWHLKDFLFSNGVFFYLLTFFTLIPIEIYLTFRFIKFFEATQEEANKTKDQANLIIEALTDYVNNNTQRLQEKLDNG